MIKPKDFIKEMEKHWTERLENDFDMNAPEPFRVYRGGLPVP
jgi:hypothetical protein